MSFKETKPLNPIPLDQWIAWYGAAVIGVAGVTVFFFMNFETRDSFAEYRGSQQRMEDEMCKRLDRIENKLDQLLVIKK